MRVVHYLLHYNKRTAKHLHVSIAQFFFNFKYFVLVESIVLSFVFFLLGRSTSHRSGPTTADPSSFPAIPPSDEKNEIENEAIDDNVDLQEVISKGSLDFDKWTLLISEIEKGMVLMLLVRPLSSTRSSLERSLLQFLLLGSMLRLEYKNTSVTVWDVGGQDKRS
ncbi:hypothetical protein AAZX31_15G188900 [Glycine max]